MLPTYGLDYLISYNIWPLDTGITKQYSIEARMDESLLLLFNSICSIVHPTKRLNIEAGGYAPTHVLVVQSSFNVPVYAHMQETEIYIIAIATVVKKEPIHSLC